MEGMCFLDMSMSQNHCEAINVSSDSAAQVPVKVTHTYIHVFYSTKRARRRDTSGCGRRRGVRHETSG